MNPSAIVLLKAVKDGKSSAKELMNTIGVKEWQFNNLVKGLVNQDYIEKTDSTITFKANSKTILFRDVASKFDVEKLLHDSNELVFQNLTEQKTINDIQRTTGLSLRTVQRAISELESIGAVRRDESGKVSLNRNHEPLYLFAEYLRTESEKKYVEPYAEIIYQDRTRTLKKVPKGKRVDGELTGFSLFSDYGIEYHTTHDYYVEQDTPLQLGEALIHAILAASKEQDKHGIVMAMIFYLKNKQRLDPLTLRQIAREYKISDVWVDVEGYLRNTPVKNQNLFLPWQEFEEKARLYAIPTANYTLPVAYPDLFKDIGRNIPSETEAYLLGGENMRLKGLKPRTKDCDLVVSDEMSFNHVVEVLKKMGYTSVNKSKLSADDQRIDASDILEHSTRSRVDIFTRIVARKLVLSDRMKKRAKMEVYGKLKLGIMANVDVFLMKGVTLREGDIQDMAKLAQSPGFDWQTVWDEMERQEKDRFERFSAILLTSLDYLYEQTGIRAPFYKKLLRHVLDYEISKHIRDGSKTLTDVISTLQGGDITEKMIRNRVDYLEKKGFLKKKKKGNEVYLEPKERIVLNIPSKAQLSTYDKVIQSVNSISVKLGLSERAKQKAREIVDRLNKANMLGGRSPKATAAAAIHAAVIISGEAHRSSAKEIAGAAEINPVSLYANYKRIKIYLRL
jgi:DNA-binding HxlR family transcriptional regulator